MAVLVLAAAAAGEYFFPDKIPFLHRDGKVGVPVGVPDASKFATTPVQATNAAPVTASQPTQSATPAIAAANETSPTVAQPDQASKPADTNTITTPTTIWNQIASAAKASEPAAPALGPSEQSTASAPESSDQSSTTESDQSTTQSKEKTVAANRRSTSKNARTDRELPYQDNYDRESISQGHHRARVIRRTPEGGLIVRLSSGRVVTLPPLNGDGVYRPRLHRRSYPDRQDDFVPPSQPFGPND